MHENFVILSIFNQRIKPTYIYTYIIFTFAYRKKLLYFLFAYFVFALENITNFFVMDYSIIKQALLKNNNLIFPIDTFFKNNIIYSKNHEKISCI